MVRGSPCPDPPPTVSAYVLPSAGRVYRGEHDERVAAQRHERLREAYFETLSREAERAILTTPVPRIKRN